MHEFGNDEEEQEEDEDNEDNNNDNNINNTSFSARIVSCYKRFIEIPSHSSSASDNYNNNNNNMNNNSSPYRRKKSPKHKKMIKLLNKLKSKYPNIFCTNKKPSSFESWDEIGYYVELELSTEKSNNNNNNNENESSSREKLAAEQCMKDLEDCMLVDRLEIKDVQNQIRFMKSTADNNNNDDDNEEQMIFSDIADKLADDEIDGSTLLVMQWSDWKGILKDIIINNNNNNNNDRDREKMILQSIIKPFFYPFEICQELHTILRFVGCRQAMHRGGGCCYSSSSLFHYPFIKEKMNLCIDYALFPSEPSTINKKEKVPLLHMLVKRISANDLQLFFNTLHCQMTGGESISKSVGTDGYNALHIMAWRSCFDSLGVLLDKGGDVMVKNTSKDGPETTLDVGRRHAHFDEWYDNYLLNGNNSNNINFDDGSRGRGQQRRRRGNTNRNRNDNSRGRGRGGRYPIMPTRDEYQYIQNQPRYQQQQQQQQQRGYYNNNNNDNNNNDNDFYYNRGQRDNNRRGRGGGRSFNNSRDLYY